jgi:Stage II sporulation protein E (SpoIIE)
MAHAPTLNGAPRVAIRTVPLRTGEPCGDAAGCWPVAGNEAGHLLAIIDGLGHGAPAAQAADAAIALIAQHADAALPELLARLDTRLTGTRGAAIGLARVEAVGGVWRLLHAGIGNTRMLRWRGDDMLRLSSQHGIVGGELPRTVEVTQTALQAGDWLLMFTDGLDEMLNPGLCLPEWERDPGLLCEHLLARARHTRDDAGVVAFRIGSA